MPTTPSELSKKLQLRPGYTVAVVNAPPGAETKLKPLPDGATLVTPSARRDAVIAFAQDQPELRKVVPQAIRAVKEDGLLWICYPKGSAKMKTDLNRDLLRESVKKSHGLEGVSLVSVDDTWSAMRFRAGARSKS